ncbi:MAG: hypothetical protein IJZ48_00765 [Oscillospiraceae bacterium]|nr:hypothetical protein [Oscillospiraceae bacterium]
MKNAFKRLLSLVMVLILLGSMLPVLHNHAEAAEVPEVLTDEDYVIVDDVFAQIDAMEDAPAKKGATKKELADEAVQIVMASENYVEGSLERNGDFFTWWTDEGIHCVYSPRMRKIQDDMVTPENPIADGSYNEPVAKKGGWPSNKEVFLIGPYYGSDDSFTDQYKNEATAIAKAIGDTDGYTLYSGTAATVDKVAYAVSNGAVVIFDSHGTTDFEGPPDLDGDGYDDEFVTGAKNSYLCLQTQTGMTNADYQDGALYGPGYAYINGATISNHMTTDSPAGILWMAICLGMATDTICEPLRERGVEVVYGYSQSVTFHGDYLFEEVFWDNMCAGEDVATSIAAMKAKWGNWDWSTQIAREYGYNDGYSTISAARADFAAFPIVVSDEDAHPGQRKDHTSNFGACSLQTVKSTYTLFSQYEVTANSNNTSWGTVSVDGSTITAKPAAGYFAQSATVTSGTATVSQNGNTFTVSADSDCTVQINFAAKTMVIVSFAGANVTAQTGYAGDAMALPTVTDAPNDYSFVGWTTAPLGADTTEKPAYYTDSFIPTGNTTLYALYQYCEEATEGGDGSYKKVTSTPEDWSGEYLIVYEEGSQIFDGSRTSLDGTSNYQSVTISNESIADDDLSRYQFTIAPMDTGYSVQAASGKYIGKDSYANGLNSLSDPELHTITMDTEGNVNLEAAGGVVLRYNNTSGQYRFRYYKSGQQPIALYKKTGGTYWYTSTVCSHTNTKNVEAVSATCTEAGYTAGVYCNDCETYISGHEEVPATGHSYAASGLTYTCTNCGDTFETFLIRFSVPTGVAAVADIAYVDGGIDLPAAGEPEGYTFVGWVESKVTATEQKPAVFAQNEKYQATQATTLYALYSYKQEGGSAKTYTLVTDAAMLSTGAKLVLASNTKNLVAGDIASGTKYMATADATFASDLSAISELPSTAVVLTLGGTSGQWTLANSSGTLLGAAANKNLAWGSGTTTWTISIDSDNNATISSTTASYGRILHNVSSPRFVNYATTTNISATMLLPQLYMEMGGVSTFYTTEFNSTCAHSTWNEGDVLTPATCTEAGVIQMVCANCGTTEEQSIPATGHSFDGGVVNQPYACVAGEKVYTCSACGTTKTEEIPASADHDFTTGDCACGHPAPEGFVKRWNVELTDRIGMNFHLNLTAEQAADTLVEIKCADKTVEYYATDLQLSADGCYVLSTQLAAAQMTEPVILTMLVADEIVVKEYSVRQYADYVLTDANNQFDQPTKDLVLAMLHYGAAAQLNFNYKTDNLANAGYEDLVNNTLTAAEYPATQNPVDGIRHNSSTLVCRDNVAVRFYFRLDGTQPIDAYTIKFGDTVLKPVSKDGMYYVEIAGIVPQNLDELITLTVNDTMTVAYGPMVYIYRQYNKTTGTNLKNLLQQMFDYYTAAEAYIAALAN